MLPDDEILGCVHLLRSRARSAAPSGRATQARAAQRQPSADLAKRGTAWSAKQALRDRILDDKIGTER